MNRIVTVVFIVIVAICIDSLFGYVGIPIVTMDLFFVPVSIALIVWVCSPQYLSGNYISWRQIQSGNIYSKVVLLFTLLALGLLSVFMVYIGLLNPLKLYIGVKGSGHGYSLSVVGLAIIAFIVSTTYVYLFKKNA